MEIKLGNIFELTQSNQTIRVIGLDDFEVLYDNFWNHNKSWTFASNLEKKGFFYRMSKDVFLKSVSKSGFQELNQEELDVFRTDLPLRISRIKNLSWDSDILDSQVSIDQFLDSYSEIIKNIKVKKIYIYPIGKDGGFKKPVLVESKSDDIAISKLLLKAKEARYIINTDPSEGIGLYRLGIEKGIPTYYIGEYIDMAGIMKE